MFSGNSITKFGNNQYKKKEYDQQFSVQRVQKQWSLAKFGKITFILFGCHRSIDFHSFYYFERVHCNKAFSHENSKFSCKSQIPVKPNSKQ